MKVLILMLGENATLYRANTNPKKTLQHPVTLHYNRGMTTIMARDHYTTTGMARGTTLKQRHDYKNGP